ncbi:uracil-DNA glycosylase family protein [Algiphilus sp.]|uniref:uracil-DNA glycosylase family protein n=1 Tax=Algiphilus sp. TaxID=1872431 RepID=UPI001CA78D57|nr:uracil-DNA glycosylase family protein [Algiphilus sp.]MBY8964320.1 uracil-DNA glycosylase family protein [Algiphilus acroporae]MCI5063798.1 uracil-DNA glycosylase family protein [Algiphilus sp.]MCI5104335.1 uracil-DNA glycosylase family protein [Algiphilus sp.]MCR9089828.1 uracil-DNA glycosylase family protein [Pseudomonadota bacterium]
MDAATLAPLLHRIRACERCRSVLPHAPRPVLQASVSARILIAGQAPGRRVHASGLPFDDPSGERLRAWMGIGRDRFYDAARIAIAPMAFCYPGTGKSGDLPPRPECAPAWRQPLLSAMPQIGLTLVIGRYAQAWHLPEAPATVTECVRAWRQVWPQQLPLPHPSPRNQRWLRRNPWFEAEVLPALRSRVAELLDCL